MRAKEFVIRREVCGTPLVDVRDVVSDMSALTLAAVEVVLVIASPPELHAAA